MRNRWYLGRKCEVGIDGNGNLLSDGTTNYTWDARDRLVSNGYGYDTGNLRTKMGAQKVLLDGIEEAREYGTNELRYDHDPSRVDGLLAQKNAAGKGYFVTDALGSVYAVVDSTGAEVSKYSYDVYGARETAFESMPTDWGLTGRRQDAAGPAYYRQRYVNRTFGQWASADPLQDSDDTNRYLFVDANPTLGIDPYGLTTLVVTGTPITWKLGGKAFKPSGAQWTRMLADYFDGLGDDVYWVASVGSATDLYGLVPFSSFAAVTRVIFIGHGAVCDNGDPKCGGLVTRGQPDMAVIPPFNMGEFADLIQATGGIMSFVCPNQPNVPPGNATVDRNWEREVRPGFSICYADEAVDFGVNPTTHQLTGIIGHESRQPLMENSKCVVYPY